MLIHTHVKWVYTPSKPHAVFVPLPSNYIPKSLAGEHTTGTYWPNSCTRHGRVVAGESWVKQKAQTNIHATVRAENMCKTDQNSGISRQQKGKMPLRITVRR